MVTKQRNSRIREHFGGQKQGPSLFLCPPSQLGYILEGQGTDIERHKSKL